jgi:hypothetical protein
MVVRRSSRLLALVALAAQGAALAHTLAVRHITCPQDGELLHAPAPSSAVVFPWAHAGVGPASTGGNEQGHERCLSLLEEESLPLSGAPASSTVPAVPVAGRPVAEADFRPPPVALLLLAPKHGPPARIV